MDREDYEYLKRYCEAKEGDWVDNRRISCTVASILIREGILEEAWQVLDFFEDPRRYWVDIMDLIKSEEEAAEEDEDEEE